MGWLNLDWRRYSARRMVRTWKATREGAIVVMWLFEQVVIYPRLVAIQVQARNGAEYRKRYIPNNRNFVRDLDCTDPSAADLEWSLTK